ncbi:vitelline membrane outer layer protein 1-like [Clarias gariepinus]
MFLKEEEMQFITVSNGQLRIFSGKIVVSNGRTWGSWGRREICPFGTYATGFSLKVEQSVGNWDDTALNGIAFRCTKPLYGRTQSYSTVQSDLGDLDMWCKIGVLNAFQLCVEDFQGNGDDTAANNIRNTDGQWHVLGQWGTWSSRCEGTGICGIETRVEASQGLGDDTSLNDVRFLCCF